MPSPRLLSCPSTFSAGNLLGTTRMRQPGPLGAGAALAVGEDLGGGLVLLPLAERAEARRVGLGLGLALEVVRPFRPLVRDDHPAADDRVFTQFGHSLASWSRLSPSSARPPPVRPAASQG